MFRERITVAPLLTRAFLFLPRLTHFSARSVSCSVCFLLSPRFLFSLVPSFFYPFVPRPVVFAFVRRFLPLLALSPSETAGERSGVHSFTSIQSRATRYFSFPDLHILPLSPHRRRLLFRVSFPPFFRRPCPSDKYINRSVSRLLSSWYLPRCSGTPCSRFVRFAGTVSRNPLRRVSIFVPDHSLNRDRCQRIFLSSNIQFIRSFDRLLGEIPIGSPFVVETSTNVSIIEQGFTSYRTRDKIYVQTRHLMVKIPT